MNSSNDGITMSRGSWIRFASEILNRWAGLKSKPSIELIKIGNNTREKRLERGYTLEELSEELDIPSEILAALEQGLLKPSEVASNTWVRLMRILEGRENLAAVNIERSSSEDSKLTNPDSKNQEIKYNADQVRPLGVASVKVIGVGGGGSNVVARMYSQAIPGVDYVAVNTDAQHLLSIDVPHKVRIGDQLTRGLGVGGDPELGREAAEESREELYDLIKGTDMVL